MANRVQFDYLPGVEIIYDFIDEEAELNLIQYLDELNWGGNGQGPNPELKRRTQHFGYLFSYRYRQIEKYLGNFPDFLTSINQSLKDQVPEHFDLNSIIVNEYELGQGIMPHTDSPTIFGPTISSLSLLSPCNMTFIPIRSKVIELEANQLEVPEIHVHLPRRSLIVLKDSSRYEFQHSISKNHEEFIPNPIDGSLTNELFQRNRRVSLTFRTILNTENYIKS